MSVGLFRDGLMVGLVSGDDEGSRLAMARELGCPPHEIEILKVCPDHPRRSAVDCPHHDD